MLKGEASAFFMQSCGRLVRAVIVYATAGLLSAAQPFPVWAQQAPLRSEAASGSPPTATATPIAEAPTIDGILNERVWTEAPALTNFVQAEPFEGEPASESTELRIVYDR